MKKQAPISLSWTTAAIFTAMAGAANAQEIKPAPVNHAQILLVATQADIDQLGIEARELSNVYVDIARRYLGAAHNAATLPINQYCQKTSWTSQETFACIDAILQMGNLYGLHNFAGNENLQILQNLIDRSNQIQREEFVPEPKREKPPVVTRDI